MSFIKGTKEWKFTPFKDEWSFYFHKPPCRFHRWMQRICFGFRWTKE